MQLTLTLLISRSHDGKLFINSLVVCREINNFDEPKSYAKATDVRSFMVNESRELEVVFTTRSIFFLFFLPTLPTNNVNNVNIQHNFSIQKNMVRLLIVRWERYNISIVWCDHFRKLKISL